MSPKVTQAHLDARRQQIIEAASACFARNGFHKTTMRDIFDEAHLSPGAVYRYFHGKEQIIQAMCALSSEWNSARIEEASTRDSSAAIIRELADTFFDELCDPAALPAARLSVQLWAEGLRSEPAAETVRESFEQIFSRIAAIIDQAKVHGKINSKLDSEAVARAFIALFQGLIVQQTFYPDVDIQAYKQVVKALGLGEFWLGASVPVEEDSSL